jgi:hypothetical protein
MEAQGRGIGERLEAAQRFITENAADMPVDLCHVQGHQPGFAVATSHDSPGIDFRARAEKGQDGQPVANAHGQHRVIQCCRNTGI